MIARDYACDKPKCNTGSYVVGAAKVPVCEICKEPMKPFQDE